jgi:hypothetical protein
MNTGPADMDAIAERTPYVLGRSQTNGGAGDPGEGTAIGVFHAIRATCRQAFGSDDLSARTIVVQGVGSVGGRLITELLDVGAKVMAADVDPARPPATGAMPIEAEAALTTPCDVLAPCATGGVLNEETIPELVCHAIAGAANNQLATPEDAARLAARDILYAPDYVANAGGVIWLPATRPSAGTTPTCGRAWPVSSKPSERSSRALRTQASPPPTRPITWPSSGSVPLVGTEPPANPPLTVCAVGADGYNVHPQGALRTMATPNRLTGVLHVTANASLVLASGAHASTVRCFGPPRGTGPSPASTSRGPSTRNCMRRP